MNQKFFGMHTLIFKFMFLGFNFWEQAIKIQTTRTFWSFTKSYLQNNNEFIGKKLLTSYTGLKCRNSGRGEMLLNFLKGVAILCNLLSSV